MALKFSTGVRNAELDSIETTIGTTPRLTIYTGGSPANTTDAPSGLLIFNYFLPADWMNAATSGTKTKLGTWSGSAVDTGVAGYFRIVDISASTTHIQGSVSGSAGGGNMVLDNPNMVIDQVVTISTFTLTAGNS